MIAAATRLAVNAADEEFDPNTVTPGIWGFVLTFLVMVVVVLLVLDMVRRIRRVNYRAEVREQLLGLSDVIATGSKLRIAPANIPDSRRVRLERMYPGAKHFAQNDVILVPFPVTNGELPSDADLIDWVSRLIIAIFPIPEAPATDASGSGASVVDGAAG